MTHIQWDRQKAVSQAIDEMEEEHLRWMMKVLLRPPEDQEMDKPLDSLRGFLNQTEADYLFQEAVLDAKKTIDASYMPYNSYYKDRLVTLMIDTSKAAGVPEEGIVFQTLASEVEVAFLQFWDGRLSSEDFNRKKRRLIDTLERIVQRAISRLGIDHFSKNQQDILATILGKSGLSEV